MKRVIKTFEPEQDVATMLKHAEAAGVKLVYLCNEALRRYLTDKGYPSKRDPIRKSLKKISPAS